jgi:hypothetical protein
VTLKISSPPLSAAHLGLFPQWLLWRDSTQLAVRIKLLFRFNNGLIVMSPIMVVRVDGPLKDTLTLLSTV